MKTKKLILGFSIALLGNFAAHAQGLDGIIVEKYYKANAADVAASATAGFGALAPGSTTYRVYVDMAPGYKLQAVYGDAAHNLKLNTTTTFFNSEDFGATTAHAIAATKMSTKLNAIDSWVSMGGTAKSPSADFMGVLKTEDDGASNQIVANTLLKNNVASMGIPLTTQDGMIAAALSPITMAGITTELDVLDATSQAGGTILFSNQAYSVAGGVSGPTATNRVLIGQFTTDGVFHFELNVQIANGATVEKYVSAAPTGAELTDASLIATLGTPPTVSITTNPVTGSTFFTGNPVTIAATAADADGTVASVQFFDGATSLGTDASSPYSFTYTPTGLGVHTITAKATDDDGNVTTSVASTLTAISNALPTAVITAPSNAAVIPGALGVGTTTITITATATDTDGPIDSVAFYVNAVRVGAINGVGPYSFDWLSSGVFGAQSLTVKSYDQQGGSTTSAAVAITISNPNAKPYFVKTTDTTCVGSGFCLPINAKDAVANVIGFDMVLHYNKAKVTPTGAVSAGTLVNPSFVTTASTIDAVNGTMIITVSLNNAAPTNTFFTGIGELICVGFNKTSNFGSIDTTSFTIDSIVESRYTGVTSILVDGGKFMTHRDSTVHASLQFWADNSAIHDNGAGVVTNIYTNNAAHNNKSLTAVNPNASGQFSVAVTNASVAAGLTLNIDRDIASTTSVQPAVNGFDALLARKVVVSDLSFVPTAAQMVAMDVNMDGKISAGDVSQINERSVLSIAEFKQAWNYNANGTKIAGKGKSKDWVFIDGTTLNTNGAYLISSVYPAADGVGYNKDNSPVMDSCIATAITNAASCPVIGAEVYTGIMLGDVNGNFKTIASDGVIKSLSDDKIVFDLENATSANGFITIPVSVVSANAVNALDFSLQLDGGITYNSIVSAISSLTAMDNLNADDATIRFTSYSFEKFDNSKPVVSVVVEASVVNHGDLKSLTGYLNGEEVNVEVTGNSVAATATSSEAVSVYPNPATEAINVLSTENASVQLINMNGTVLTSLNVNANQKQVISTENLANGVYTVKVSSASGVTVKMIVVAK